MCNLVLKLLTPWTRNGSVEELEENCFHAACKVSSTNLTVDSPENPRSGTYPVIVARGEWGEVSVVMQ